jgi:putative transposase
VDEGKDSGITLLVSKPISLRWEWKGNATMSKTITLPIASKQEFRLTLDEIAREGARRMLMHAMDIEVDEYVSTHTAHVDEQGHRLVVRNGVGKQRSVTFGSGVVTIQAPRVNDKREGKRFISQILPPYLRQSPKVESLLPLLYLKGISTNKFQEVFRE